MTTAFDAFAGSGWAVACRWHGIRDLGAELMPEARGTRDLNGFETPWSDVTLVTPDELTAYMVDLHIASPPCQTYSVAGNGTGRTALRRVLDGVKVIASGKRFHPNDGDPRTWLVLEPLRLALAHQPVFIV